MMKKILSGTFIVLSTIFVLTGVSIFASSMSLSDKVKAGRSQHNISSLQAGSFIVEPVNKENAWNYKVMILKSWQGRISVLLIPTEETGQVIMPERFWGWGYYKCKNFGPDTDTKGKLLKTGKIKCHDEDAPEWMSRNQWVWDYTGKSIGMVMEDIHSPSYEIKENTLYING